MGNLISKQCLELLNDKRKAVFYAAGFSLVPFFSWISVVIVCLVTLRKGSKIGSDILLPALVVHLIPLMLFLPISSAVVNTLLTYVPCYIAAIVLRVTGQWQTVFGVILIQVLVGCLGIQILNPDFVLKQFELFELILKQYEVFIEINRDIISTINLAQFFWGIQLLSAIISGLISLLIARSIQSKLFFPDGFKNELLSFRSGKISFLILLIVAIGSYYNFSLTINLLPLVLSYFLVSGFVLIQSICTKKMHWLVPFLLILLVLIKPVFVVFSYILFGVIDSLFNLKAYLPERQKKSV